MLEKAFTVQKFEWVMLDYYDLEKMQSFQRSGRV
jgi:hypothetical protein